MRDRGIGRSFVFTFLCILIVVVFCVLSWFFFLYFDLELIGRCGMDGLEGLDGVGWMDGWLGDIGGGLEWDLYGMGSEAVVSG